MPPESVVDQALQLKKRARRRLVGAIALVIIMLIILPNILKDQTALQKRAPIKLTMPEVIKNEVVAEHDVAAKSSQDQPDDQEVSIEAAEPVISVAQLPESITPQNNPVVQAQKAAEEPKPSPVPQQVEARHQDEKSKSIKKVNSDLKENNKKINAEQGQVIEQKNKPNETKVNQSKPQRFLIQIGVYSDEANVKQLQLKIADASFTSRTAKLQTPKGEKIRLRVGSFVTREAAAEALKKIQASGLTGMVLIDE